MGRVFLYVVDRDFGFAPNPFHGCCTLATCKPRIRNGAQIDDWIIGMGGGRLKATGRCVFGMRVTAKITFDEYWSDARYFDKRPVRIGSRRMLVGDNIYRYDADRQIWCQADCHHSNPDGSPNTANVATDTSANAVLISRHFYYFGRQAPHVPNRLLRVIGFKNGRNYRVFEGTKCADLVKWLETAFSGNLNQVMADPFDFDRGEKRYSVSDNKIR